MALKGREKESGDKRGEKEAETGKKMSERVYGVSGEDHVSVVSKHLPGTLKSHWKLLEIS